MRSDEQVGEGWSGQGGWGPWKAGGRCGVHVLPVAAPPLSFLSSWRRPAGPVVKPVVGVPACEAGSPHAEGRQKPGGGRGETPAVAALVALPAQWVNQEAADGEAGCE